MPGEQLKRLADCLLESGPTFMDGFGSVWGLSVSGTDYRIRRQGKLRPPGDWNIQHKNFVRYLHSPNIWTDDQTPWTKWGTKRNIQRHVNDRDAFGHLCRAWFEIVSSAQHFVDISSLEVPVASSEVGKGLLGAIANCISEVPVGDGPPLVLRLLFGGTPQSKTKGFVTALSTILRKNIGDKPVRVLFGCDYRGVAGRAWKFVGQNKTWNHSKIVAADGWRAITGGHNMNAEGSYTQAPVVHDLSVEVFGHGAHLAHDFASSLWRKGASTEFLDAYQFDAGSGEFKGINADEYETVLAEAEARLSKVGTFHSNPRNNPDPPGQVGYVPADAVMGLGRWGDVKANGVIGNGVKAEEPIGERRGFQYCSDHAKRLLIAGAKSSICVSQQDLVNNAWTGVVGYTEGYHDACDALGRRLAERTPIQINVVVSARYAQDSGAAPYSYGNSPRAARDRIAKSAGKNVPRGSLCTVAPLVFCPATGVNRDKYIWPDAWRGLKGFYQGHVMQSYGDFITKGFGPGNHAKALMIDDTVVLIGSDNMYPSPLAEFSFVIEGPEAIAEYKRVYWDPLWGYSARMGLKIDHNGNTD